MVEMFDFSHVKNNDIPYGGNAGYKQGICWNGENWLLKFPKSTRNFRKVEISYTTSPLSEYVGSHVYQLLDIPVHETVLGIFDKKVVVACKVFLQPCETLYEFKDIKNIYTRAVDEYEEHSSSTGTGTELNNVLKTIELNRILARVPGVTERFWDMFVVDAFIGNNDRNNGNWGLIYHSDGTKSLAPVYDNGNSFRNKASDRQLEKTLSNRQALEDSAYRILTCVYTTDSGKAINPFEFIKKMENTECNAAVQRIVPKIRLHEIAQIVDEIPERFQDVKIASPLQKEYFKQIMTKRYADVLVPVYEQLRQLEQTDSDIFQSDEFERGQNRSRITKSRREENTQ